MIFRALDQILFKFLVMFEDIKEVLIKSVDDTKLYEVDNSFEDNLKIQTNEHWSHPSKFCSMVWNVRFCT